MKIISSQSVCHYPYIAVAHFPEREKKKQHSFDNTKHISSAFITYKSTHGEQAPDPLPRQATDTQVDGAELHYIASWTSKGAYPLYAE